MKKRKFYLFLITLTLVLFEIFMVSSGETIICNQSSDCGTNGFIGNPFCQNHDVFQNFITYNCNNPETFDSLCNSSTASQLKETCSQGQICLDGQCTLQSITYPNDSNNNNSNDSIINDSNVSNNLNSSSNVTNDSIINDTGIGNDSNSSNNISNDLNNNMPDKVNSPMIPQSFSSQASSTCTNDSECNDGNISTQDHCNNPGSNDSSCSHIPIICFVDSQCGNNG